MFEKALKAVLIALAATLFSTTCIYLYVISEEGAHQVAFAFAMLSIPLIFKSAVILGLPLYFAQATITLSKLSWLLIYLTFGVIGSAFIWGTGLALLEPTAQEFVFLTVIGICTACAAWLFSSFSPLSSRTVAKHNNAFKRDRAKSRAAT